MSIQLATIGEQDVYITGKPSVTYFSAVYLRHTPFIKQTYELPFDNQTVITGYTYICTFPKYGDFINDITLKTVLPALSTPTSLGTFYWPYPGTSNSYMFADYGSLNTYTNGYGVALFQATQPFTSVSLGTLTNGNWWYDSTGQGGSVSYVLYSNLFQVTFNTSTLTFTITCPATAAGLTSGYFIQWVNPGGGSPVPVPGPPPQSITFPDLASAQFLGFTSANTAYPLVKGSVTGNQISTTGWIYGNGILTNTNYYDGIGTRIITEARLLVGQQVISTLEGAYIDIMNDIDVPYENQVALIQLVGKNDSTAVVLPRYLYTKLNFGIKNIPICCLERHDVSIEIDYNTVLSQQINKSNVIQSSILVEYATVGNRELKWLTQNRQVYVYESMLYRQISVNAGDNYVALNKFFKFPTKELYITLQTPANANTYVYSNSISAIDILFKGQELINYSSTLFNTIELFESKVTMPTRAIYMYKFNEPINFSRISDIQLKFTSTTGSLNGVIYTKTLNVFIAENGLGSLVFI